MRSQVLRSSSSSEEIITTVTPLSRLNFFSASSTRALAPTSMPRVGSETKRNLGSRAKALARQTFCWLPPESSFAFCLELVHLIFSSSIYLSVTSRMAFSSRHLTRPPRRFFRNLFWICMAGKATFHSRVSSRSRPTPRRSSDTKASCSSRHFRGLFRGMGLPSNSTVPPASYRPITPLGMPSLPWPARPPMPRISPSFTSRFTLRTISPGISTQSLRMDRMVFASEWSRTSCLTDTSTLRPTMALVMRSTSVSEAGTSSTTWPSRMMTTLSQTDRIS